MNVAATGAQDRAVQILLVEDNRGDVILAQKAFGKAKIPNHLTVATNGMQALEILRQENEYADASVPDLILLDLNLPKKSGKDVLAEIKADEQLRRIPVIIMSSSRAEVDVEGSYALHANSYIAKPSTLEKYGEVVSVLENFWFSTVILPGGAEARH